MCRHLAGDWREPHDFHFKISESFKIRYKKLCRKLHLLIKQTMIRNGCRSLFSAISYASIRNNGKFIRIHRLLCRQSLLSVFIYWLRCSSAEFNFVFNNKGAKRIIDPGPLLCIYFLCFFFLRQTLWKINFVEFFFPFIHPYVFLVRLWFLILFYFGQRLKLNIHLVRFIIVCEQ